MSGLDDIFTKKEKVETQEQETTEQETQEQSTENEETVDKETVDESAEETSSTEETQEDIGDKQEHDKFAVGLGYENFDAFLNSGAADKIKKYEDLSELNKKITAENEELFSSYEQIQNPFVNEKVYKINKLLEENEGMGAKLASKIADGDFDNTSDLDVIMLSMNVDDPDIPTRLIKKDLERKYDIDDWGDLDDDTKELLELDARRAKKKLSKLSDIEVPEKVLPDNIREKIQSKQSEAQRSIEEIDSEWSPALEKFDDAFKELPLPIPKKDKNGNLSYETISKYVLSNEDKSRGKQMVQNIVRKNKLSLTKENVDKINHEVMNHIYLSNLPKMFSIVADKAVNDYKETIEKGKYNPTPEGKKVDNAKKKGKKSIMDL